MSIKYSVTFSNQISSFSSWTPVSCSQCHLSFDLIRTWWHQNLMTSEPDHVRTWSCQNDIWASGSEASDVSVHDKLPSCFTGWVKLVSCLVPRWCSSLHFLSRLGPAPGRSLTETRRETFQTLFMEASWQFGSGQGYILNMASSLTRQQVKLSKSMISLSAYRATSIWYNLLLSLNPEDGTQVRSLTLIIDDWLIINADTSTLKRLTAIFQRQTQLVRAHTSRFIQIELSEDPLQKSTMGNQYFDHFKSQHTLNMETHLDDVTTEQLPVLNRVREGTSVLSLPSSPLF